MGEGRLRKRVGSGIALCCAALFVLVAGRLVWTAAGGGESLPKALVFGLVALGFAVALIRRSRWALRALAAVFVLTAIILPVGIWNPFTAGDYMAGGREPPTVSRTLVWLVPLEVGLLAMAFVVDPSNEKRPS